MKRLTKCCCCSVRTGALVIGSLALVMTVVVIGAYGTLLGIELPKQYTNNLRRSYSYAYNHEYITETTYRFKMELLDKVDTGLECALGIILAYAALKLIFSCLLLAGISKNKHRLMLPWLIASCMEFVINCMIAIAYPIFCFVMKRTVAGSVYLLSEIPWIVLCFYVIRVVHSEYKNIKEANLGSNKGLMEKSTLPYKVMV